MDDDNTRATDLAAAWPEDDDLTLSGAADKEEILTEVYSEPEPADQPDELGGGSTEEYEPASEPVQQKADPDTKELTEGADSGKAAEGGDSPNAGSPVSWSATAREQWKHIPKAAQEYIQQREQQMAQGMQKNAEQAQRAEAMDRSLAPYQQYFSMNGGAGQTINTLLQTGSGLQMGSPQQKAQIVANIISQYGVDVASLDNLITGGEVTPEATQTSQLEQLLNERLAPMQQQLQGYQQREQQQQQSVQTAAGDEVSVFAQDAKNEFYNDVRGDMADILEMSSNRGINLSLKQAYDKACLLNPEISRIMQSREAARNLAPKRKAAASVSGGMGGPGASSPADSMRGAIEDAWDHAGQM